MRENVKVADIAALQLARKQAMSQAEAQLLFNEEMKRLDRKYFSLLIGALVASGGLLWWAFAGGVN